MINVALHGAEFFGKHGFYPEEQLLGSKFVVDISADFEPQGALQNDKLADTVNYEHLYELTFTQMQHPRKLIETLCQAIIDDIVKHYPYVAVVSVTIKKLNPPLRGKVDHSSVTITYNKPENGI
ncbi:dihydroneopterin aldolase [Mucilaginibacter sp.]|jgi:dihydroneopterin aldolase|uniref:dihydroneopterin aldolase n=1 Tax=Mucilaginibacter sp. TaxID=1882438 RepID=UPI002C398D13|nr:dihydroneopterin aldolase [Mucilaginibacter sp.]HTI61766.1 dihydroneopterin aldolase [Mucilaginibacter sp.]